MTFPCDYITRALNAENERDDLRNQRDALSDENAKLKVDGVNARAERHQAREERDHLKAELEEVIDGKNKSISDALGQIRYYKKELGRRAADNKALQSDNKALQSRLDREISKAIGVDYNAKRFEPDPLKPVMEAALSGSMDACKSVIEFLLKEQFDKLNAALDAKFSDADEQE